ncbi:hypothetical protein [Sphingobacterium humi]|uniref:Uncharacterized protein n=1 Tax=Sphingobacterium humi TaxID=1796905 RepID=A0A6N8L3H9_9SPHI|nr:hypothetical protein [Sphingobacterium humi]MVZ63837.1 hypothetical protein [Sphingobacterium humi]
MNKNQYLLTTVILLLTMTWSSVSYAQFGNLLEKASKATTAKGVKLLGIDKILKEPEPISTNFSDVDRANEKMPDFQSEVSFTSLKTLSKNKDGNFLLQAGNFEIVNKSYCLKAGTYAPSSGDGYMYAPTLGKKKDIVIAILKNAENHPEVKQEDIQMLLWTIIARTKFSNYAGSVKVTALKLLSPKQLLQLEGGALGILPLDVMQEAKNKLPKEIQAVFEAENQIRELVSSGNYTLAEFEQYAILAGMAPVRQDTPSGIWSYHPDGYYIRYFPSGYSRTRTQIHVPQETIDKLAGKVLLYDATDDIACPANVGSQRLAQTNEAIEN